MSIDMQLLAVNDNPITREEINRCLINIYKKMTLLQKSEMESQDVRFDPTAERKTGV